MSKTRTGETRLRADAQRHRDRLLLVAHQMINDGEVIGSLAAIAGASGLGAATVYRNFPTLRALLETLARQRIRDVLASTTPAAAEDPFGALGAILANLLSHVRHPQIATVLAATTDVQTDTAHAKAQLDAAIAPVLRCAQQAGLVRADITVADLRCLLGGIALACPRRASGPDRADLHLTVLLAGIRLLPDDAVPSAHYWGAP